MADKPIAIVLGGTVPHSSLVQKLQKRGYYTILLDYLENPPAKQYADEHIKESTLDKEVVLKVASERNASLVIATCIDQANSTCCYVAEKLGLPHPYNYQTSIDVTDKVRMKDIMIKSDIPTSRYVYVTSVEEALNLSLQYPLMVKPADSNSANGVKKVLNEEELRENLPIALKFSRNKYAIVEEFVEGVEISAYCVIVSGKAHLLMTQERVSVIEGEGNVIKCFAAFAPARISKEATQNAENIATKLAKSFGLDNTPLFFQGIVRGDKISVIEFAPRIGGGMSFHTIHEGTGFDILESSIDSFLGTPISLDGFHHMDKCFALNQIYGNNGYYDHTTGCDQLLSEGICEKISFYKPHGDYIDASRASSSRIGVMVFCDKSPELIRNKILKAFEIVDSYNTEGKSMMRHDLNFGKLWEQTLEKSVILK